MKILYAIHCLDMGGMQLWLSNLIETKRPVGVLLDIMYVHEPVDPLLEGRIEKTKSQIFGPMPSRFNIIALYKYLKEINSKYGPYDVVHANLTYNGGLILLIFRFLGVPVRILHLHSVMNRPDLRLSWKNWRWWILSFLLILVRLGATNRWAVSQLTGESYFGPKWGSLKGDDIVPVGIPQPRFLTQNEHRELQQTLGVPSNAKVIGHVGRLVEVKNQLKLLQIMASLEKSDDDFYLIIVGDGPLRDYLQEKSRSMNLGDRVIWTGVRNDAKDIMQIFDVIVFPSFSESFGLAILEAQVLGISVVASDGISEAVVNAVPSAWAVRIPLSYSAEQWCEELKNGLNHRLSPQEAKAIFRKSVFNIEKNLEVLIDQYQKQYSS